MYSNNYSHYGNTSLYSVDKTQSITRVEYSPEYTWFSQYDVNHIASNIKLGNVHPSLGYITETPDDIVIPLKLHQKRILSEMINKENSNWRSSSHINMCVLGDKVGSGKSMDILALIANKPFFSSNNIIPNNIKYKISNSNPFCGLDLVPTVNFKTNLLVVPHGIYNQWQTYIERDTKLNYIGLATKKSVIELNLNELISGKYTITLVKSTRYNDLMDKINEIYPTKISTSVNYNSITGLEELTFEWNDGYGAASILNRLYYRNSTSFHPDFIRKLESLKKAFENLDIELVKSSIKNASRYKIFNICKFEGPLFERVIFDETDSINISNSRAAYGKFNWFVTSSIESLIKKGVRRRGFLKDVFKKNNRFQNSNFIQDIYLKNNDTYVDNSFNLPDPVFNKFECFTPDELKILKGVALPQVVEALNAGYIETAITMSGCEVTTSTNIVDVVLDKLIDKHEKIAQKIELYEPQLESFKLILQEKKDELKEVKDMIEINSSSELMEKLVFIKEEELPKIKSKISSKKDSIKNLKKNLLETLNKIESIKARITNISEKTCPVCADTVTCPALTPCCKNYFCLECIGTALTFKKICPLCRKPLNLKDMTVIKEEDVVSSSSVSDEDRLPTKQERLLELINSKKDGRFLVFSSYDNSFNTVRELLNKEGIPWSKLCGNTYQINKIIKKYSENKIRVLLLNAKYYGSGFNLQMTTDIVIYHRMDADLEKQIIGRGQRLGRTSPLNINYLCYETEL